MTSLSLLSRARNPTSDKYYSHQPPDVVRYFKCNHLELAGVRVSYEDNKGDAILVIEGPSRAIAAARDDLDRQAKLLCRRQYGMSGHTLEAFRAVSHSNLIQGLRGARAWAGWHANAEQGILHICGKDQSAVETAFSAITKLFKF